ncbi:MAG: PDDEXK nuclease domain-containing protein [Planctomycetaceae bacterium]
MKKKAARKTVAPVRRSQASDLAPLIAEVRDLIQSARTTAAATVNALQVMTNFEIGRRIVEQEQKGEERAAYGAELLKELSARLTDEFGRGFSQDNLSLMRKFYTTFGDRVPISATVSRKLLSDAVSASFLTDSSISETLSRKSRSASELPIAQTLSGQSRSTPFRLSWSHYVLLMGIKDPAERSFYEIEAANEGWSLSELKRQKACGLYERLALSRDKQSLRQLATEGQLVTRPQDILKEPYVLEFLGLDERAAYSETDLESALIDHLEHFLLELGKGFLFESRQRRFTFDEDHYFVDLVFYNRLLRCYVLIDLKLDKLTHQDLGQMQMYVNYFDRHVKLPEENPTIGLLLCKSKKQAIVELTLPDDANVHAREYQLYLPSKDLLKRKLLEWTAGEGA